MSNVSTDRPERDPVFAVPDESESHEALFQISYSDLLNTTTPSESTPRVQTTDLALRFLDHVLSAPTADFLKFVALNSTIIDKIVILTHRHATDEVIFQLLL